jgi:UDP-N-acetylmuramate: L-alanyl-gamma-D-glutamyl-meso-diaminopimelate ligase
MKLGAHRDTLAAALAQADASWVLQTDGLKWDLVAALANVSSARVRPDTAAIVADVTGECRPGDAVVVMSNGDFQNIRADLAAALAARAQRTAGK